jgi:hypothetical protein
MAAIQLFSEPSDLVANVNFARANGYVTIKDYGEKAKRAEKDPDDDGLPDLTPR